MESDESWFKDVKKTLYLRFKTNIFEFMLNVLLHGNKAKWSYLKWWCKNTNKSDIRVTDKKLIIWKNDMDKEYLNKVVKNGKKLEHLDKNLTLNMVLLFYQQ